MERRAVTWIKLALLIALIASVAWQSMVLDQITLQEIEFKHALAVGYKTVRRHGDYLQDISKLTQRLQAYESPQEDQAILAYLQDKLQVPPSSSMQISALPESAGVQGKQAVVFVEGAWPDVAKLLAFIHEAMVNERLVTLSEVAIRRLQDRVSLQLVIHFMKVSHDK